MALQLDKLQKHIKSCFPKFKGEWINGKRKYDTDFAETIKAKVETDKINNRYWDCIWKKFHIELKLGKTGAWFNLVRYSEIFLNKHPLKNEVITLCMRYSYDEKLKVGEISSVYFLETPKLIKKLGLTKNTASQLVKIKGNCPRDFNAQASLTYKDIGEIATLHISK